MADQRDDRVPFEPIHGRRGFREHLDPLQFPEEGMPGDDAYELIHLGLMLDGQPSMNLASFVTTWMEPEAEQLIHEALRTNHIDHEEYPVAVARRGGVRAHARRPVATPPTSTEVVGVGTIGSSEAIMLGLLAHKFSWRNRREAAGLPDRQAQRRVRRRDPRRVGQVRPLLRRRDAQDPDAARPLRACTPTTSRRRSTRTPSPSAPCSGTTFIGENDPIAEINDLLVRVKAEKGWDIPLHVDGASGGVHRPVRPPRRALGLPPRAGGVDQRLGPQVRARLPRRRLAGVPGPRPSCPRTSCSA